MSSTTEQTIRCTVHWLEHNQPRQQDILVADRPIRELAPILVESLGLSTEDDRTYTMRPGPRAPAWPAERTLAEVGIRDGDHIWVASEQPGVVRSTSQTFKVKRYTCFLILPNGADVALPQQGQAITRGWLLQQLPSSQKLLEQIRFLVQRSPYQAVSASAPHCKVHPLPNGSWVVETGRNDVEICINNKPLIPHQPVILTSGDRLLLGGNAGVLIEVILQAIER